ncbi:hypothetical protein [Flavobacterium sp.]|uniref:hypothetical protein n=1 Tax=Flavobacterium sp. TaxID=239 RepID=UPI002629BA6C|nr:hypothetical protein [Flavobacterium sp.]
MPNFTADDLMNKDYSPTVDGGDNPKYRGVLDRNKVDKTEEYEVVYFCNKFLEKHSFKEKATYQKVERLLRHKDIKDEDDRQKLIKWIEDNWNK